MKRFFQITGIISVIILFAACGDDTNSLEEQLIGEWTSTAIKIDGVAQPNTVTMTMNLKSDRSFQLSTTISSLIIPTTGVWVVEESNSKIILNGDDWEIHHITNTTLRIDNTVDGKEIQVDFEK